ncbi:Hypothetical_protein [Hexamita inflata]|uniref:Hypothetical_protein n=1 Tax=Hexamita inflata TaxID=28002 RepID=A0AA86UTZ7_9EUKA|nr:Hypothetical protein HINF_LOCUS52427 [Hexamita inflata]
MKIVLAGMSINLKDTCPINMNCLDTPFDAYMKEYGNLIPEEYQSVISSLTEMLSIDKMNTCNIWPAVGCTTPETCVFFKQQCSSVVKLAVAGVCIILGCLREQLYQTWILEQVFQQRSHQTGCFIVSTVNKSPNLIQNQVLGLASVQLLAQLLQQQQLLEQYSSFIKEIIKNQLTKKLCIKSYVYE